MESVLIAGVGRSGEWATRLLLSNGGRCFLYDDRDLTEADVLSADLMHHQGVKVVKQGEPLPFNLIDTVVISPGFGPAHPVRVACEASGVPVISEVEFAHRYCHGTIFGITGSNGKTTVTALTAHILKAGGRNAMPCGNFGTAFSQAVLENSGAGDYVLELSSFQLEHIRSFRPDFAALLNLTPDHLDRYSDVQDYYLAKMAIFRNMDASRVGLLNCDDETMGQFEAFYPTNVEWIGSRPESLVQVKQDDLVYRGDRLVGASEMKLKGMHNLYNAAFAAGMALLAGVGREAVAQGIRSFAPIEHRLELVAEKNNIRFFNDSKATNFDSVAKALTSFNSIRWIAGGKFKGGNFEELSAAGKNRVHSVYLIGESAGLFFDHLKDTFNCQISETLEQAVSGAWHDAEPGDVILLAPGCASFDQFKNYEVRGDRFRELAQERIHAGNRG